MYLSSKNVKHLREVCLGDCIRETPLNVYKYYYEDVNTKGYGEAIGPTAEDFDATFNIDHEKSGDEYESMWSLDGAALGLAIENLKDIDALKTIVTQLYGCIQKLEA